MRDIAGEIEGIAGGKLVRHALNDESHLTFEDVNDLLLGVPVLGHATPGPQRGDHLIHRPAVRNRAPCDAGTNLNRRIFSFHLQSLRGRMSRANAAAVSAAEQITRFRVRAVGKRAPSCSNANASPRTANFMPDDFSSFCRSYYKRRRKADDESCRRARIWCT